VEQEPVPSSFRFRWRSRGFSGGAASRQAAGHRRSIRCAIVAAGFIVGIGFAQQPVLAPPDARAPDVRYEPTPMKVVQQMLWLADANSADVVYDLGCGDARIVITAVRRFGARGVCVDIDPRRIAESRENAQRAGVADRIRFLNEDLFSARIGDATVVMLFLSPALNVKLRPKLLRELKPGTRIVSHWHNMDDWKPDLTAHVLSDGKHRPIYLWTVPSR
jgi:SAM-dependent methyltransferase